MQNFDKVPQSLKSLHNWVLWKLEIRDGIETKVPYQINGHRASHSNPETWSTFERVYQEFLAGNYSGIGFVFNKESNLCGIDIDKCRNPTTGEIEDRAIKIIKALSSYTEISPSGTGVHIIANGTWPYPKNRKDRIEVYNHNRYFTVTGNALPASMANVQERQSELEWLYKNYLNGDKPHQANQAHRAQGGVPESLQQSDTDILRKCRKAKNGTKFSALYDYGDTSAYEGDDSRADSALCCLIAFYTQDFNQIDRLFRGSRLYRSKWEREDYRQRTIAHALGTVTDTYKGSNMIKAETEFQEQKPKQDKTRFEKIDFVDFLTREIPPIEIILDPWLTTRSLNMMYAERGCGKTLIALAIAYSIASGKPFISKWPVLKQTTVCYFDGEMSAAEFQERCRGINLASLEKGQFEIITNDFQPRGMPDFGTQEGQRQALDLIGDAEVVVIDNLSCLLRSGGPENDSESWGLFQEWLLMLKRLGKTVLFLHHAGKSGAQRGTSKREDQLNEVLGLKHPSGYRKSDGLWVQVKYEKGRRLFGQAAEPIEIKLETDILGKYIWKSLDVNKATKDKIISLLREGMPPGDIATEVGVSGSYVRRVKRDMDKEGAEKQFNDESNDVF